MRIHGEDTREDLLAVITWLYEEKDKLQTKINNARAMLEGVTGRGA
jgi:hypothetical protein